MFSPPRTIRSVRRSTTTRRPAASSLPRSPVRTGSSAGTGGLAEVPGAPRRPGDDDLAHAVGPRIVDAHGHPGEGPARRPGRARRLRGRQRRDAGAHLGQPVRRHDRPARAHGPVDERRRDRPAPEQHRAERGGRWGVTGRVEQADELGRDERDVAGRRADRSARSRRGASPGGRIRIGTPSRIARHRTPAGHVADPQRQHPAGRGRQGVAPCVSAGGHRPVASTTPFGRPVVPEVKTTTAGASGPASVATTRAGNGASTPPSTTIAGSSSSRAVYALPDRGVPGRKGSHRGADPEERDDHSDGFA